MADHLDINRFFEQLDDTRRQASVDGVFGAPIEADGKTVIPIAAAAFGFGMGAGESSRSAEGDGKADLGLGGGSGYVARPMAMAVIDRDGVRIQPVEDENRIAQAGMLLGAWTIFWTARVLLRLIGRR